MSIVLYIYAYCDIVNIFAEKYRRCLCKLIHDIADIIYAECLPLLIVQKIQRRKFLFHQLCRFGPRVYKRNALSHYIAYYVTYYGIVRTAHYERVDALLLQRRQILARHGLDLLARGHPGLDELDESGARLLADRQGLVLLTDDGDYAHRMLSPKKAIFKRYQAVLDGPADDRHVALFHEGTSLEDGTRCLPAKLTILRAGDRPLVEVEICEGKYHQIKRMFEAVGRKVLWLKRYAIGGLVLDPSLPEEKCRELTPEETAAVFF